MKKLFFALFFTVAFVSIGSCTKCQQESGDLDLEKNMGTLKSDSTVASVYYRDSGSGDWVKTDKVLVMPGMKAFAMLDNKGQLRTLTLPHPKDKDKKVQLIDVGFEVPDQKKWYRGLVVINCFKWEPAKNIADTTAKKNAPWGETITVNTFGSASAGGRAYCNMESQ